MTSKAAGDSAIRAIRNTAILFFEPVLQPGKVARNSRVIQGIGPSKSIDTFTDEQARDLITFNQPRLIEYIYLASQKHKMLRQAMQENANDLENIEDLRVDLIKYLNAQFFGAIGANFQYMHSYFSARSMIAPRICVKGNFRTENRDAVITIFRDSNVDYDTPVYIDENTGVEEAYKTGRYYLSNDLVDAISLCRYKNPRINYARVSKILRKTKFFKKAALARQWLKIWNDPSNSNEAYKSTLVIPITLSKNKLSDEFIHGIRMESADRIIFGFLCIDHTKRGFFDEERDIRFGYAVADILSIYAFTRLQFTDLSHTYVKAEEITEDGDRWTTISAAVKDAISEVQNKSGQDWRLDVRQTVNNVLVSDERLIDFLRQSALTGIHGEADFADAGTGI